MKTYFKIMFARIILLAFVLASAGFSRIVINEVMSVNKTTVADEDGDFVDWIELYNDSDQEVSLQGHRLSDDPEELDKWLFPATMLPPRQHVLVFASGKDRRQLLYWDTIINRGDLWKYRRGTSQLSSSWKRLGYNDDSWDSGPSGFGYSDDDDATVVQSIITLYVRKTFMIDNVDQVAAAVLHVDYDDAFVAYMNGVEIARANIGSPGQTVRYNTTADGGHEALMIQGLPPERFDIDLADNLLQDGENVLAIEVHNVGSNSSDMTLIPFFSLAWREKPQHLSAPPDFLNLKSASLHANFKIKGGGESLVLVNGDGQVLDSLKTPELPMDISYGRIPDGGADWRLLARPTPGAENEDSLYVGKTAAPIMSPQGGLYNAPLLVALADTGGGTIYYTLDGSEPDQNSHVYSTPISVSRTTVVRARSLAPPLLPSRIVTNTFVMDEDSPFAIICLTTDPFNLYDNDYGILVKGDGAANDYPYFGANFWQDWERPMHVAFYEPDGQLGFELDVGVKIFGGWSRGRDQKSLAIFQRSVYDTRQIDYQIFPDKDIHHFESLILRNGGNDWDGTLFRDGFMQYLCKDVMDLEIMAFRPAHIYLNGEYWGILNIREKINEHFVAANRGVDPDRVDILDRTGNSDDEIMAGSNEDYLAMWDFMQTHDIGRPENYAVLDSMIDISNFIDYQIAEIYIGNTDWPGNNIKYYKPQTPGGKWRWLIFDTDFGFHLYNDSYNHNTLEFATAPNGPGWPNPPWSTLLLRKLLENDYFRLLFINRFADHINTTFHPERVHRLLDYFQEMFDGEIDRQRKRWPGSAGGYQSRLQRMRQFADRRPSYMRSHIRKKFKLQGDLNVTLSVQPAGAGVIKINSKTISDFPWTGVYFENVPVPIKAVPGSGYRFTGWSDPRLGSSANAVLNSDKDFNIVARFETFAGSAEDVLINEINYNSGRDFPAKDWIELYNRSKATLSLAGWSLTDGVDDHNFIFPETAIIPAEGCCVVSRDTTHFSAVYSNVNYVYGNLEFDLNNAGEFVQLSDNQGMVVDSLTFDDALPWPVDADGEGLTLELKSPLFDNNDPSSWSASAVYGGTPGRSNSVVTRVAEKAEPPRTFRLAQNFPNPFNASTTIRYDLAGPARIQLTVYDLLGRQLAMLVDARQESGVHRIVWNAAVPSGIYFYKLSVESRGGKYSETKKMLLVR